LMLFSDDYIKFSNYLETGMIIFLTGTFRQRYNKSEFEFKVSQISLLESLMKSYTRKLQLEANPRDISQEFVDFITENVRRFPGNSSLKFCVNDGKSHLKFGMYTMENGFEMNDEMASYLQQKPEFDVQIELT
ncbi:MAG: OB-fold nucleic acid binding domain-containing protein, partial [Ginsengibacter sp.]